MCMLFAQSKNFHHSFIEALVSLKRLTEGKSLPRLGHYTGTGQKVVTIVLNAEVQARKLHFLLKVLVATRSMIDPQLCAKA